MNEHSSQQDHVQISLSRRDKVFIAMVAYALKTSDAKSSKEFIDEILNAEREYFKSGKTMKCG